MRDEAARQAQRFRAIVAGTAGTGDLGVINLSRCDIPVRGGLVAGIAGRARSDMGGRLVRDETARQAQCFGAVVAGAADARDLGMVNLCCRNIPIGCGEMAVGAECCGRDVVR